MAGNNSKKAPVLTIDGPSGAGKGTLSQLMASRLQWHFLDSGALYRLTALSAHNHGIDLDAAEDVATLAEHLDIYFDVNRGRVLLEGDDVTQVLRTEETGASASRVAAHTEVRKALLERQRAFRTAPGLVADGRDMGTVVFPDADLKIFLTASANERAKRRLAQLQESGSDADFESILADVQSRDERDRNRAESPLLPADDAETIDSTHLTIEEVLDAIQEKARARGLL
ncbi:MAG: (d)CMP kinase [Natronospirillum sp.]|uniref:(d)CMP kinase n=1 Tax=Natronospirillum sp. TaxID=2812955 RepID=UPI0025E0450C|nr:(d)CMP kinase [Natronospirillum sp.]MCH8553190.1 (d)CMP kinase [Natronospirillum sp.]